MNPAPSLFFLGLSFLIASCGVKPLGLDFGHTTKAQLILEKGEPLERQRPSEKVETFVYTDNEKYQVMEGVVTHFLRDPTEEERTLLYWEHKFKDCDTRRTTNSQISDHLAPEYKLECSAMGLSVIYTQGSEFVSRVVENAKE